MSIFCVQQCPGVTLVTDCPSIFAIFFQFIMSSGVKFFCFVTLLASLSLYISALPPVFVPSAEEVNIRLSDAFSTVSIIGCFTSVSSVNT